MQPISRQSPTLLYAAQHGAAEVTLLLAARHVSVRATSAHLHRLGATSAPRLEAPFYTGKNGLVVVAWARGGWTTGSLLALSQQETVGLA